MSRTSEQLESHVRSVGEQLEEIAAGGKYWIITENWECSGDNAMYEYPDLIDELMSKGKMKLLKTVYSGIEVLELDVPMGALEEANNNDDGTDSMSEEACWEVLRSIGDSGAVLKALEDQEIIKPAEMRHYFDDSLDFEITVGRRGDFKAIKLTVAWGGPNVYVDSSPCEVRGHWGCDEATYPLSYNVKEKLWDHGEELYSLTGRCPDAFSRF
jgi:hypothetical protein